MLTGSLGLLPSASLGAKDKNGKMSTCPGKACKSPCDCTQGEDCRNGNCVRVSPAIYCCTKSGCRAGQACVNANGTKSTCAVECKTHCDCKQQGQPCSNGTCYPVSSYYYCCTKAGCPTGQACYTPQGQRSQCSGSSTTCKVRCECNQGQDCINGQCVRTPTPAYCCDRTGCPAGYICKDKSDTLGFCPNTPPPPPVPNP